MALLRRLASTCSNRQGSHRPGSDAGSLSTSIGYSGVRYSAAASLGQGDEIARLADQDQPTGVDPREVEQVVNHPAQSVELAQDHLERVAVPLADLVAEAALEQLGSALEGRQRASAARGRRRSGIRRAGRSPAWAAAKRRAFSIAPAIWAARS